MNDKELLAQMVNRSVNNILSSVNPAFRMFSGTITNYIMDYISPYVDAFTNPDTNHVNTKAATAYIKEETSKKIEDFMKRFEEESKDGL